jgi:DNA ligase-4
MVISVKETTVFSVFHQDAQDLFNICSDLKKVAWELWDPTRRLNEEVRKTHLHFKCRKFIHSCVQDKTAQIFRAFAPMLCKRPTAKIEETVKEMQGKKFIIEEKLDGERIQLHKRGNEYFYCSRYEISTSLPCFIDGLSRKGKDYTYLYGKHVGAGSLTPYIHEAFDERVEEYTL